MNWSGKSALVTGADGFIGSHLIEALVRAGAEVTALSQYNSFDSHGWMDDVPIEVRAHLRMVRGDIRDFQQMVSVCNGQEVIFHLAALIAIPFSYQAPHSYIQSNVQGTTNLLSAALSGSCQKFVQTSTSEVYGTAQFTPINEDHPLQAQSPYAASKIAADKIAESFYLSFGLPVVTLRPFNTFGPRQSERAVISAIIRQIIDDDCTSIKVGSLEPARDFNFVSDTVDAFLKVAELGSNGDGLTFNVGSGEMITIGTLVEELMVLAGCSKPVETDQERVRPEKSEVLALMADAKRLKKATNWESTVTLSEGLLNTLTWWRGRQDKLRPDFNYAI